MLPGNFILTAPFAVSECFWKLLSLKVTLHQSFWMQSRKETEKFLGLRRQLRKETGDSVSGRMRRGLGQQHQGAGKSYATVLLTYCI